MSFSQMFRNESINKVIIMQTRRGQIWKYFLLIMPNIQYQQCFAGVLLSHLSRNWYLSKVRKIVLNLLKEWPPNSSDCSSIEYPYRAMNKQLQNLSRSNINEWIDPCRRFNSESWSLFKTRCLFTHMDSRFIWNFF